MPKRHHIGLSFDFVRADLEFIYWHTACGMKFADTSWENVRDGKRYSEVGPATANRPQQIAHIPGVGSVYPAWRTDFILVNTDCDMCDRYIQLSVLAKAEL